MVRRPVGGPPHSEGCQGGGGLLPVHLAVAHLQDARQLDPIVHIGLLPELRALRQFGSGLSQTGGKGHAGRVATSLQFVPGRSL